MYVGIQPRYSSGKISIPLIPWLFTLENRSQCVDIHHSVFSLGEVVDQVSGGGVGEKRSPSWRSGRGKGRVVPPLRLLPTPRVLS